MPIWVTEALGLLVEQLDRPRPAVAVLGELADAAASGRGDGDLRTDEEGIAGDEQEDDREAKPQGQLVHSRSVYERAFPTPTDGGDEPIRLATAVS